MNIEQLAAFGGSKTVKSSLPKPWPYYSADAVKEVAKAISHGDVYSFGKHPALTKIENWARDYFSVRYALAVSSGTAALFSAFKALGISCDDEVLVQDYTFHATVTPLLAIGAKVVLVDSLSNDCSIDPDDLENKITNKTRAIVVSHMFGFPADMDRVLRIGSKYSIPIIEDASQAHGAEYKGIRVGGIGDVGCLSLGGAKPISGGMGGLLLTNHKEIFDGALVVGHAHERALEENITSPRWSAMSDIGGGHNFRMSPIAAILAYDHARNLDNRINERNRILNRLSSEIQNNIAFLEPPQKVKDRTRGGWYGYKARYIPEKLEGLSIESFILLCQAEGVNINRPSTKPISMNKGYYYLKGEYKHCDEMNTLYSLPNSTMHYKQAIGFPDKHFHVSDGGIIDEYILAFKKIEKVVSSSGSHLIEEKLNQ